MERAAGRRHAIMVSPTQAVPEVPAVWGNEYPPHTIACRRYAIMVGSWIMIFGGVFWWGFVVGFCGGGFELP